MKLEDRHEFFRRLQTLDPHPTTELEYQSTFELLIAVILSAQATDISVNLATRRLYRVANTPGAIFDLGEEKLVEEPAFLILRISWIFLCQKWEIPQIHNSKLFLQNFIRQQTSNFFNRFIFSSTWVFKNPDATVA